MTVLSPLDATLVDELRVLTEIGRNCPPATPIESILTDFASVTPLSATLTKTMGEGEAMPADRLLLNTKGLLHTEACPSLETLKAS
jgi:hypothetical protein